MSDGTQCNQVYIHNGVTQNHNRHLSKKHGITGVFSEKILSKKLDESHQLLINMLVSGGVAFNFAQKNIFVNFFSN